jgi:hypothetical protein
LAQPHPAPRQKGSYWIAEGARAWVDGNRLAVDDSAATKDGPSDQAVRAAACAAWAAADDGVILDRDSLPPRFA